MPEEPTDICAFCHERMLLSDLSAHLEGCDKRKAIVSAHFNPRGRLAKSDQTESLIAQAIEQKSPIETIERLVALKERIDAQRAKEAFTKALAAFQEECPIIKKRKRASGGDKGFNFDYAPLEHIVAEVSPLMKKHGFSYRFDTDTVAQGQAWFILSKCTIQHSGGHSEVSSFKVPTDTTARMGPQQKFGSAGSYANRNAFKNALGIMTAGEDDENALKAAPIDEEPRDNERADKDPLLSEDQKASNECEEMFQE